MPYGTTQLHLPHNLKQVWKLALLEPPSSLEGMANQAECSANPIAIAIAIAIVILVRKQPRKTFWK